MEFLSLTQESIEKAAQVIKMGGIVAFPTETVYGLGADVYNTDALIKIFEAKGRPRFDPLIIHISSIEALEEVSNLSFLDNGRRQKLNLLTENFWPGPLSIVLPKNEKIPDIATAGLSTAAIRIPCNEAARALISLSSSENGRHGAIAAPSANPFGSLSPTRAEHVRDTLGDKVDIILDGGLTEVGLESTVLDMTDVTIKILRHGGTPKEAIENLIGEVDDGSIISSVPENKIKSPGRLKSHYSPQTPLSVFSRDDITRLSYKKGMCFLFFDDHTKDEWLKRQKKAYNKLIEWETGFSVRVLSPSGNLNEAAARLFENLHQLDKYGFSQIAAQLVPDTGIGMAINDRLQRAAAK